MVVDPDPFRRRVVRVGEILAMVVERPRRVMALLGEMGEEGVRKRVIRVGVNGGAQERQKRLRRSPER